jgi:serpin B
MKRQQIVGMLGLFVAAGLGAGWVGRSERSEGSDSDSLHALHVVQGAPPQQEQGLPPKTLDGDVKQLVQGNNEFAFDLYRQLAQKDRGNIVFSPYSISTALGMTYAGARVNTAKEMAQTLHFTLGNERLHPAFSDLIRKAQGVGNTRSYELAVANSLWGDKTGLALDPNFLRITETDYQAGFEFADFRNAAEGARGRINAWVESKTDKRIEELFPAGLIDSNTRLVLVNAIYFKGEWSIPFPKDATKPDDFTIPGAPLFKVPMMNRTFIADYTDNDDFQLAQFMYKGDDVSMVFILPKKKDGLPEVEKKLSAKALGEWLGMAGKTSLQVSMPRFKMTERFRLEKELEKLGIKDAFLLGLADFTGMQIAVTPPNSLFISAVVHKALVGVDEVGTEAAAATGIKMSISEPPPPIPFRADHPLFFVLRHNPTGSILFLGRLMDPRGE